MPAAIGQLMPFEEAVRLAQSRGLLPTNLTSADLQALGGAFHRQNLTSARTTVSDLLQGYKDALDKIINPQTVQRPDRVTEANPLGNVTEGLDQATARLQIKQLQAALGMGMTDGSGPITDLRSNARINLVLETQRDTMRGAGQFLQSQSNEMLDAYPCWELIRVEARKQQRDWKQRWRICSQVVGDVGAMKALDLHGRMIARKDSPIWQALGDGQDGSTDTLGNPYPPFAFNSGMDVRDIGYREARSLGLVEPGQQIQRTVPSDLGKLFSLAE